jgi:hypothetical protein
MDWDKKHPWSIEDREILAQGCLAAASEDWTAVSEISFRSHITIATDASDDGYGYTVFDDARQRIENEPLRWESAMAHASIFLKELAAAVRSLELVVPTLRPSHITLVCDNTAAYHVMRRKASTTHHGNELVERLVQIEERFNCTVDLVLCPSAANPSDPASRNKKYDEDREIPFWLIVDAHTINIRCDVEPKKRPPHVRPDSGIRHTEPQSSDSEDEEPSGDDWDIIEDDV